MEVVCCAVCVAPNASLAHNELVLQMGVLEAGTVQDDQLRRPFRGWHRHQWVKGLVLQEAMMKPGLGGWRQGRGTVIQRPEPPLSVTLPCKDLTSRTSRPKNARFPDVG
jgi:hypothetical protein